MFDLLLLLIAADPATPKLPPPSPESEKAAVALVADLYRSEWAAARTAEQKAILAEKLISTAESTKDDRAGQYALLRVGRDVATQAGNAELTLKAIGLMAEQFSVDPVSMRADALESLARLPRAGKLNEELHTAAIASINEAIAADAYEAAGRMAKVAVAAASGARDPRLVKLASAATARVAKLKEAWQKIQPQLAALEANNPGTHAAMGRFLAIGKGDWLRGLPHLASGSEETLSSVAKSELGDSPDPLVLADAWWEIANQEEAAKRHEEADEVRRHAAEWYKAALDGGKLEGLTKKKAEERGRGAEAAAVSAVRGGPNTGLLLFHFEPLPTQTNGDVYVEISKLKDPVSPPDVISEIGKLRYNAEKNGVAIGLLKIDVPGVYEFRTYNYYDRNALWVANVVVCPYRGSVAGGTDEKGLEKIPLRKGYVPFAVAGYVGAKGSVDVWWRPPGQKDWTAIPADVLFFDERQRKWPSVAK